MFHNSSAVEQLTVNQSVVGSIPTCGAIFMPISQNHKNNLDFFINLFIIKTSIFNI